MDKIFLTVVAVAVFCGSSVSAVCDNSTAAKVKECVFESHLMQPNAIPQSSGIDSYCRGNATANCIGAKFTECQSNDRQTRLLEALVSIDQLTMKQEQLCNDTQRSDQTECYTNLGNSDCLQQAVGTLNNAGEPSDLKNGLDAMCTFFDAYAKCMKDANCPDFEAAVKGARYKYCDYSENKKQMTVKEYQTGVSSASVLSINLMSVFTLVIASIVM